MEKIKLVALPCLCADVFDGTDEIRPGGEELNFTAHAQKYAHMDVMLLGAIGDDAYGKSILESIKDKQIHTEYIRIEKGQTTANNMTYLTPEGDRYYKPDSWNGSILEHIVLTPEEINLIKQADVVATHYYASCFAQILELKKQYGFKLAVDFSDHRDFEEIKQYAPYIDFFMSSGSEEYLHYFEAFSKEYDGLFNMSLAEAGLICSYLKDGDIIKAMEEGSKIASETLSHFGGF